ncbi:hypothetical protein Tco_0698639 [Tanacetum coccineum]
MEWKTCDPIGTPMEIKDKLDLDHNGSPVDAMKYHSMIGALMYLTFSRPDIVHATCLCARYRLSKRDSPHGENLQSYNVVSIRLLCPSPLDADSALSDYGFNSTRIPIFCDSKSAITYPAKPLGQHQEQNTSLPGYHCIKETRGKGYN